MAEHDDVSILHPREQSTHASIEGDCVDVDLEKSAANEDGSAKDPNIVTFDQPYDPENPMDWSSTKKIVAIIMVTVMTLLSYVL